MSYYSDPTAAKALGSINREFSRLEKKARKIRKGLQEGRLTPQDVDRFQAEFTGIYRHVLNNILKEKQEET